MAERVLLTDGTFPTPEAVVAQALYDAMAANEEDAVRIRKGFWDLPRGTKGAPLPTQDRQRDTYKVHSALYPDQLQSFYDYGSIRSGKTDGVIMQYAELMAEYPFTRTLGARRTYSELHNSLIDSVEKAYRRLGFECMGNTSNLKSGRYAIRRGLDPRIWLPNGSVWIFIAWEKADKAGEGKADTLGGSEFALALIEEANECKEGFYDTVVGRMSQRNLPAPIITVATNPPDERHWLYKKFILQTEGGLKHHFNLHFFVEDNRINLGDSYVEDIIARYSASPTLYKKFYLGEHTPTVAGTALFRDRFRREAHVSADPLPWNQNYKLFRCWDFGFVAPACVVFQVDESNGQIRVLRSYLGREEMIDTFANRMVTILNEQFTGARWRDVGDIAGKRRTANAPKSEMEMLEAVLGHPVEVRPSHTARVEYGLTVINDLLSTRLPQGLKARNGDIPAIIFCPGGAAHIIDGFEFGYCQDPDAAKKGVLAPLADPTFEHAIDAFRYGVVLVKQPTTSKAPKNPERKLWRSIEKGGFTEMQIPTFLTGGGGNFYARTNLGRRPR